jgi:MerR family copper efflux transcriptional regulator
MRISELARATGVSPHALRHYERLGLLRPARSANGYRDYPESIRREVVFIAMSRRIGMPLKAIAAQLPAYRSRRLTPDAMIESMRARIDSIDAEIAALRAQRRRIVAHVKWVRARAVAATTAARGPFDVPRRRRAASTDSGD